ncbi:hypothetical protein HK096_006209 [Nowakowskiella sp. JEL0078]|nr:hypothetical protein HK096_006209 [Nowakowskiella sp. JEL0078]
MATSTQAKALLISNSTSPSALSNAQSIGLLNVTWIEYSCFENVPITGSLSRVVLTKTIVVTAKASSRSVPLKTSTLTNIRSTSARKSVITRISTRSQSATRTGTVRSIGAIITSTRSLKTTFTSNVRPTGSTTTRSHKTTHTGNVRPTVVKTTQSHKTTHTGNVRPTVVKTTQSHKTTHTGTIKHHSTQTTTHKPKSTSTPGLLGEWSLCTSSSQCASKCCSNQYSKEFKCTNSGTICHEHNGKITYHTPSTNHKEYHHHVYVEDDYVSGDNDSDDEDC